jgi:SAM-dependent methyltransferase
VRTTTAGPVERGNYAEVMFEEMPLGLILNIGAGNMTSSSATVVSVDLVAPRTPCHLFVIADAASLPFRVGVFDGVIAKDVLEHVGSPIQALLEARRASRPQAPLVATVPRAIPRAVWDDPTHVRGFTARALQSAASIAGWDVRTISRIGGFPGAARLRATRHLERLMRVPGFGHWYGTNWLLRATAADVGKT